MLVGRSHGRVDLDHLNLSSLGLVRIGLADDEDTVLERRSVRGCEEPANLADVVDELFGVLDLALIQRRCTLPSGQLFSLEG